MAARPRIAAPRRLNTPPAASAFAMDMAVCVRGLPFSCGYNAAGVILRGMGGALAGFMLLTIGGTFCLSEKRKAAAPQNK